MCILFCSFCDHDMVTCSVVRVKSWSWSWSWKKKSYLHHWWTHTEVSNMFNDGWVCPTEQSSAPRNVPRFCSAPVCVCVWIWHETGRERERETERERDVHMTAVRCVWVINYQQLCTTAMYNTAQHIFVCLYTLSLVGLAHDDSSLLSDSWFMTHDY